MVLVVQNRGGSESAVRCRIKLWLVGGWEGQSGRWAAGGAQGGVGWWGAVQCGAVRLLVAREESG